MCDYFKITRLKRIFYVTELFSYWTFHGYTLFETIEKISFLGGQENGSDFENEEEKKKRNYIWYIISLFSSNIWTNNN